MPSRIGWVLLLALSGCTPPRYLLPQSAVEKTIGMTREERKHAAFVAVREKDGKLLFVRDDRVVVEAPPVQPGVYRAHASRPHRMTYLGVVMLLLSPAAYTLGAEFLARNDLWGVAPVIVGAALTAAGLTATWLGVQRGGAELGDESGYRLLR